MHNAPDSIRALLRSLSQDLSSLVAQTLGLARTELGGAARTGMISAAIALGGVTVALGGLLVIVSALVLIAVRLGLPPWAAASLVGVLLTGGGAAAAYVGVRRILGAGWDVPHTRHSLRETISWLKAQATN